MKTQQEIRDALGVAVKVGDIVTVQNARILWPNFGGVKDKFNSEGDRNFNLELTEEEAERLAADGWNVKCKPSRPDDPESGERCVLKITVNFDGKKPPKVIGRGSLTRKETQYHGGIAGLIDAAEIVTADISFVAYFWEMPNGNIGLTAYLRTMYFILQEDELDLKWNSDDVDPEQENANV